MDASQDSTLTKLPTPACLAPLLIAKHVLLLKLTLLLTNVNTAFLLLNFHKRIPAPNAFQDTYISLHLNHALRVIPLVESVKMQRIIA